MNRSLTLGTAALALATAAPAFASTATLTHRESVNHIQLIGGYGPASVTFTDGSLVPVTGSGPAELRLAGSDSGSASFSVYSVNFSAAWDQRQNYSFQTVGSDTVLQASGSLAVQLSSDYFNSAVGQGGSPATESFSSSNWQSFEFELDETTSYSFNGSAVDGHGLQMFTWSGTNWTLSQFYVSPGSGVDFSNSGQIAAGRYLLRNLPNAIFRTGTSVSGNAWDYTLTLHNTVAAVPEPATMATMLAGLGLMGWRLRGRRAA
jgi:hypothetical protein